MNKNPTPHFDITDEHRALVAEFIAASMTDARYGVDMARNAVVITARRKILADKKAAREAELNENQRS